MGKIEPQGSGTEGEKRISGVKSLNEEEAGEEQVAGDWVCVSEMKIWKQQEQLGN